MSSEVTERPMTVTKSLIIDQVHERLRERNKDITKRQSAELVECIFRTIKSEICTLRDDLSQDEEALSSASSDKKPERRLKISGFGNFVVRYKRSRPGRNPQSGAKIAISSRYVLTFKPSSKLKEAINTPL
jgi:integration host factor subunit alpha